MVINMREQLRYLYAQEYSTIHPTWGDDLARCCVERIRGLVCGGVHGERKSSVSAGSFNLSSRTILASNVSPGTHTNDERSLFEGT